MQGVAYDRTFADTRLNPSALDSSNEELDDVHREFDANFALSDSSEEILLRGMNITVTILFRLCQRLNPDNENIALQGRESWAL